MCLHRHAEAPDRQRAHMTLLSHRIVCACLLYKHFPRTAPMFMQKESDLIVVCTVVALFPPDTSCSLPAGSLSVCSSLQNIEHLKTNGFPLSSLCVSVESVAHSGDVSHILCEIP